MSHLHHSDLRALSRSIVEEVRENILLSEPRPALLPPHDIDSEALVLSSILDGYVTIVTLRPLSARDFYSEFNRALFSVLESLEHSGEQISLELVTQRLRNIGLRGRVQDELRTVWFAQPFVIQKHLHTLSMKLRHLRLARAALSLTQDVDRQLRTGAPPVETLTRLRDSLSALLTDGEPKQPSECPPATEEHSENRASLPPHQLERRPAGRPNEKSQALSVAARPNKWPSNVRVPKPSEHGSSTKPQP